MLAGATVGRHETFPQLQQRKIAPPHSSTEVKREREIKLRVFVGNLSAWCVADGRDPIPTRRMFFVGIRGLESALTHWYEAGYQRALTARNHTGHNTLSSCSVPLRVPAGGYPSLDLTVHLRLSAGL